jgi:benzoyl-CoA reductase/2-hydroxyglutaryl-CoA dehydratase subunit BcrC/BadD/HgdB
MLTAAYTSPFVPPELIEAHGWRPQRLIPDHPASVAPQGACPFASALVETAVSPQRPFDVLILAATCDQMRRAAERISDIIGERAFVLNMPATWQTTAARELYANELARLGRFLLAHGGHAMAPNQLRRLMLEHDDARAAKRSSRSKQDDRYIPLALIGGPLRRSDRFLYDVIESAGAYVALDGTETGVRSLAPPFDRARVRIDPMRELIDAYFRIPDIFRRPNGALFQYLLREIAERSIRAMVLVRFVWCDLWHAEFAHLRERIGLPAVEIDLNCADAGEVARVRTRIGSLMESLR